MMAHEVPDASVVAAFHSCCTLLLDNRFAEAERQLSELCCRCPPHPAVQHNLALSIEMQGQYERALRQYETVCKQWPEFCSSHVGVANCHRHLNQFEECKAALKLAVGADPDDPRPHILLSEILFYTGKRDYNDTAIDAHLYSMLSIEKRGSLATTHYAQAYMSDGGPSRYHMFAEGSLQAKGVASTIQRMQKALQKAVPMSVVDVVCYICNAGYVDLVHNSLVSKSRVDDTFTVVLCLDSAAMRLANSVEDATFVLFEDAVEETHATAVYNTPLFNRITALKSALVHCLLLMHKFVVFVDGDVTWMKPIVRPLAGNMIREGADLAIQIDAQDGDHTLYCTGLFAAKPSPKTASLFHPDPQPPMCAGEQPVINHLLSMMDVKVFPLPRNIFPNGEFWRAMLPTEIRETAAVHHNFLLAHQKIQAMKTCGQWHLDEPTDYQDRVVLETSSFRPQPHSTTGYNGPWIENVIFEQFMKHRPRLKRVYVPVFWTDVWVDRDNGNSAIVPALQNFVDGLDRSLKYVTVLQNVNGFGVQLPPGLDMRVFSAARAQVQDCDVKIIPLLKRELPLATSPPTLEAVFAGSLDGFGNHDDIRRVMKSALERVQGFEFYHGPAWEQRMRNARFNLCPRGFGPTSFRLYESLQLGRVPVIIHDDEDTPLPYENEVPWREIAVFVHRDDIANIPHIIAGFNWQHAVSTITEHRHRFTYDHVARFILHSEAAQK